MEWLWALFSPPGAILVACWTSLAFPKRGIRWLGLLVLAMLGPICLTVWALDLLNLMTELVSQTLARSGAEVVDLPRKGLNWLGGLFGQPHLGGQEAPKPAFDPAGMLMTVPFRIGLLSLVSWPVGLLLEVIRYVRNRRNNIWAFLQENA